MLKASPFLLPRVTSGERFGRLLFGFGVCRSSAEQLFACYFGGCFSCNDFAADHGFDNRLSRDGCHNGLSLRRYDCFARFTGLTFGFALTATHFTWVIWCAASTAQCYRRCDCSGRGCHFFSYGFDYFGHCNRGGWGHNLFYRLLNLLLNCGSYHRCFYRHFCHYSFGFGFDGYWSTDRLFAGFGDWVADWLGNAGFYCDVLDHYSFARLLGAWRFANGSAGSGDCYGSNVAVSSFFTGFFAAFDRVAIRIALALTTIAATTLTTGATTWTIATFAAFLLIILQSFISIKHFFISSCSLLDTWLTLFTRLAWLTRLTLRAFATHFFGRYGWAVALSGIQRLTQFARLALFTWLAIARLALFARWTRLTHFLRLANFYHVTRGTFFAWRTLFARGAFLTWSTFFTGCTRLALFAWCTFFTWATVFARLALFVVATATAAVLLATVATLIAALRAFAGFLLDDGGLFFFLAGEQADQ